MPDSPGILPSEIEAGYWAGVLASHLIRHIEEDLSLEVSDEARGRLHRDLRPILTLEMRKLLEDQAR